MLTRSAGSDSTFYPHEKNKSPGEEGGYWQVGGYYIEARA